MEQDLLRRGQRVVLETVNDDRIQRHTFVVDLVLPQQVFLTPLTEGDIVSVYKPQSSVRGYIPTPVRAYQFESVLIQSRKEPTPLVVIALPEKFIPVQRRRFFRVKALLRVQVVPLSQEGEPLVQQPIEVYGTDVNAGGVRLRIDLRKLPKGLHFHEHQRMKLTILLPPVENRFPSGLEVEAVSEVVWVHQNRRALHMGVTFTSIDRRLQERIVSWCFAYQCRLIRLGLWQNEV